MGVTNSNPNSYEEMLKRLQQDRNTPPPVVAAPALSPAAVAEMERLHKQDADDPIYSDGVTPTETLKPVDNNAWYDAWVSQLEPPMDAEEKARRERAAYISSGIMNLGNAFGAIGNMFAARHGAPAQKMADIPDVDTKVNAFRDRADKVRNAYLNGLATREKMRQQDALLRVREQQLAETKRRQDYLDKRLQADIDWRDVRAKNMRVLAELKAQQQEIDKAYKEGRLSTERYNAETRRIQTGIAQYNAQMRWGDTTVDVDEEYTLDALGRKTGTAKTTTTSHTPAGRGGSNTNSGKGNGNSSQTQSGGEKGKGKVDQNKLAGFSIRK